MVEKQYGKNMKNIIKSNIQVSIDIKSQLLNNELLHSEIKNIVNICVEALSNGNTIWWCGNGGSAADAQHLAAELSGRFYFDLNTEVKQKKATSCFYSWAVSVDSCKSHSLEPPLLSVLYFPCSHTPLPIFFVEFAQICGTIFL